MNISGSTISFPFQFDLRGTLKTTSNRDEIIAQAIQDILETRQGERRMVCDYGIPDFVFAVQDFGFAARLAYHLEQQVLRYVPLVRSLQVVSATDVENRAVIEIQYTEVGAINAPKNLVYPVWRLLE